MGDGGTDLVCNLFGGKGGKPLVHTNVRRRLLYPLTFDLLRMRVFGEGDAVNE